MVCFYNMAQLWLQSLNKKETLQTAQYIGFGQTVTLFPEKGY